MRPYRGMYPQIAKLKHGEFIIIPRPEGTPPRQHTAHLRNVVEHITRSRGMRFKIKAVRTIGRKAVDGGRVTRIYTEEELVALGF